MREGAATTQRLSDYRPSSWLIDQVELEFQLNDDETRVTSMLRLRRNPVVANDVPLVLDGEDLELLEIELDGEALPSSAYTLNEKSLTLHSVPDQCELKTLARIFPQNNTRLEGLYQSSGMFCTQCEAEGFRRITWFIDRPDVLSRYRVTLEADRGRCPVLLSNGNLVEQSSNGARHRCTFEDPFPKPAYLFALVAGDLSTRQREFTTRSGRNVQLCVHTESHNIELVDHALDSLERAMRWDEERFDLEYDLDQYHIVAVDDFNMGAMENKGLNIFNSKYVLASPETATDDDYVAIEAVVAHEYFHNWTGNRVTCRDWFQLSLKEGLTVFRDQEFTADLHSRAVKRISDVRLLRALQFAEDASPMAHPIRPAAYEEINNFYTVTVYEKGAEVVRLYQTLLGRDGFAKGLKLYFERHDGQAVTTEDFLAAMADANQVDLSQMQRWYDQAGTPELTVRSEWEADAGRYTLHFKQEIPQTAADTTREPVPIPLSIGLISHDGVELAPDPALVEGMKNDCLIHAQGMLVYEHLDNEPVPSLLRGSSAPVVVRYDYSDEQLALMLASDSDTFNRWDAGQRLAGRLIHSRTVALAQAAPTPDGHALVSALQTVVNSEGDSALKAEILTLPSEAELAEGMNPVDVDNLHIAREMTLREIGQQLSDPMMQTYLELHATMAPDSSPGKDWGDRAYKNCLLAYLVLADIESARARALDQVKRADNMTDVMGALRPLSRVPCDEREQALTLFEQRWRDHPLVLDKWFSLQALSPLDNTLETTRDLMQHPGFDLANPNRVRALIGAFASNPVALHAKSGAGYEFLADRIVELDPLNPQVAARLAKALSKWRQYDADRQRLMREQLERIVAIGALSPDVGEIVTKSLD